MESKDLIGLDVGNKHTGMARASSVAQIAVPLKSIDTSEVVATIKKLMAGQLLEAVVVGLPRNLSGEDTDQTTWVRDWVADAKSKISLPFYWQDEALTSKLAESLKLKAKGSIDEHALAAAIILQDFLDEPAAARVPC